MLRPRGDNNLTFKALPPETALLLLTLQTPSTLPRYALESRGLSESALARLVLDGVLEVEVDGEMLSGPGAHKLILREDGPRDSRDRLTRLSHAALEYAVALDVWDPAQLSARLYMFERAPASLRWRRVFAEAGNAGEYLRLNDRQTAQALRNRWSRASSSSSAWISWSALGVLHSPVRLTYKLYVSPACGELRATWPLIVKVVARSAAFHFKVGSSLYGLLRPDKIVAYFRDFAELQGAAVELSAALDGCEPHGVPFTAAIGEQGLTSWGVDPPSQERFIPRESWRGRICHLLASALVLARSSGQPKNSAIRFATGRLRLEGIDTDTWAPTVPFVWRD